MWRQMEVAADESGIEDVCQLLCVEREPWRWRAVEVADKGKPMAMGGRVVVVTTWRWGAGWWWWRARAL